MTNQIVSVEIAGQRYPIRSSLDVAYVTELASYVDEKMKAAADAAPTSDMLGLALLVALNIADECFRARQQSSTASGELNERALRLERLVDDVLGSIETAHTGGFVR